MVFFVCFLRTRFHEEKNQNNINIKTNGTDRIQLKESKHKQFKAKLYLAMCSSIK